MWKENIFLIETYLKIRKGKISADELERLGAGLGPREIGLHGQGGGGDGSAEPGHRSDREGHATTRGVYSRGREIGKESLIFFLNLQ
jgi:hypothetical protein